MTLATPAIWLACCAAAPALWPATSTCTSPPQAAAAVTVLSVAPLMVALSCSAITSKIGRASCRERSVDLGGRRIIKKKKADNKGKDERIRRGDPDPSA